MQVLVTGATGFVGRHLVPALVEAGHRVRGFCRPASDRSVLEGVDVAWREGDVLLPTTLARAVQGVDAVVHLVAILRERESTFEEVNVEGVRNVAQACQEAGVRRVVHMGSLGTGERHPTRYGRTKALGERIWRDGELPYVILRPSLILGPESGFVDRLADLVRRYEKVPVPGSGESVVQPVCIQDVVRATVAALQLRHRRTYAVVGPERVTWNDFVLRAAEAMGKERSLRHVPPLLARLVSGATALFREEPLVTRDELYYLQQDLMGDPDEFRELTGRAPTPLETCLRAAFEAA